MLHTVGPWVTGVWVVALATLHRVQFICCSAFAYATPLFRPMYIQTSEQTSRMEPVHMLGICHPFLSRAREWNISVKAMLQSCALGLPVQKARSPVCSSQLHLQNRGTTRCQWWFSTGVGKGGAHRSPVDTGACLCVQCIFCTTILHVPICTAQILRLTSGPLSLELQFN